MVAECKETSPTGATGIVGVVVRVEVVLKLPGVASAVLSGPAELRVHRHLLGSLDHPSSAPATTQT